MGDTTLVLNADFQPHSIVSWKDAIVLLVTGKAHCIETYDGWEIRSASLSVEVPAVLVLSKYVTFRQKVKFSRPNVYARDDYQCQYCGKKVGAALKATDLTFDHVVPRSTGGETSWVNIVTACRPCNTRKGAKPLEKSGMSLLKKPKKPDSVSNVIYILARKNVPESWESYLTFLKKRRQ